MLFVTDFTYPAEKREAVQARFKETGGKPPAGVKMIGRWHAIGAGKGVHVCECDDPMAMAKWVQDWSDLLTIEIYPALDDAGAAKRLAMR
jgi:hypothetical protein